MFYLIIFSFIINIFTMLICVYLKNRLNRLEKHYVIHTHHHGNE